MIFKSKWRERTSEQQKKEKIRKWKSRHTAISILIEFKCVDCVFQTLIQLFPFDNDVVIVAKKEKCALTKYKFLHKSLGMPEVTYAIAETVNISYLSVANVLYQALDAWAREMNERKRWESVEVRAQYWMSDNISWNDKNFHVSNCKWTVLKYTQKQHPSFWAAIAHVTCNFIHHLLRARKTWANNKYLTVIWQMKKTKISNGTKSALSLQRLSVEVCDSECWRFHWKLPIDVILFSFSFSACS